MVTQDLPKYRYRVDAADVVVWVGSYWLAFARENGAPALTEAGVLGRSIWDFVSGQVTRDFYFEIHTHVRLSGRPVVLAFRCDSPALRRHMRLTITRDEQQLLYESMLIRVETQPSLRVLDAEQPRSDFFLTVCSVCSRGLLEPVGWLDLGAISDRLHLLEQKQLPQLHYDICPACAEIMRAATAE